MPEIQRYEQDLCHAGNDRHGNYGLTSDVHDHPDPNFQRAGIPAYFTCANEATPPISYPCTGSKHPHPMVEVVCTCPCHRVAAALTGEES